MEEMLEARQAGQESTIGDEAGRDGVVAVTKGANSADRRAGREFTGAGAKTMEERCEQREGDGPWLSE